MRYMLLALLATTLLASAQQADYRKMSSMVRQAVLESQSRPYVHTRNGGGGGRSIMAFVSIDRRQAAEVLSRYGCRRHAQWGDVCIAEIPLSALAPLSSEHAVRRIEANRPASLLMDTTASIVNALPAYEPSLRHQAYTGEGVVMGVVDVGFALVFIVRSPF